MRNPFETVERRAFHDSIARFMETEIWPHVDEWDEAGSYPHEINERFARLACSGLIFRRNLAGLALMTSTCAKPPLSKWAAPRPAG